MGKPFESELKQLADTYHWALGVDLHALKEVFCRLPSALVVGSGGSLSSAVFLSDMLLHRQGRIAKAETPYIARSVIQRGFAGSVVIISAGGENPDVLGIARTAIEYEVDSLISVCCRSKSTLSRLVSGYGRGQSFEFVPGVGGDGFLATNSLVALNVILARANAFKRTLPKKWPGLDLERLVHKNFGESNFPRELIVLYGPDSRAAAVDLESKFSEAALGTVQAVDIRNFAHGRHNWLHRRPSTGVICLVGNADGPIMSRTLAELPEAVAKIVITSGTDIASTNLGLQAAVFELTRIFGLDRGLDPGRPGIPPFGRKVYHINAFARHNLSDLGVASVAVRRKQKARGAAGLKEVTSKHASRMYDEVKANLMRAPFRQIIFDYDGTLCDHRDRFKGLREDIAAELSRLLEAGIAVGIATGRGKSVRQALTAKLDKGLWSNVVVGYYNSTLCLPLDAEVVSVSPQAPELKAAHKCIQHSALPDVQLTLRPTQLTVESTDAKLAIGDLWRAVLESLDLGRIRGLKVVSSSRSIDILTDSSSKMNLLESMPSRKGVEETLFIGDRPRWPGNDHEMLDQVFSLSVDEVTPDLTKGWNLAPAGVLNADASMFYLRKCKITKSGFRIMVGKVK